MSTTAVHGMNQYVAIEDPNNLGTFVDVSAKCHGAGPAFSRDEVDTGTFGTTDKTLLMGMRDQTMSVDFYNDSTLRDLIWSIYVSDTGKTRVRYGPEGNGTGSVRLTASFGLGTFGDGGNITSPVGGQMAFHRDGATTKDTF